MPVLETAPELKLSVAEISNLTEQLQEYCAIYNPLFRRAEQREYAGDYVHGLLLDLPRKSVEPMVLTLYGADGNAVRGMQQFLGEGKWDDWVIRQRHWQQVNTSLGEDDGVFIIDGSDFPKQGEYSVGVKRQYCGQLGKRANCQAGVFLGYASRQGYTLLDCRLYLPEEWVNDEAFANKRQRCGVPKDIKFTTKPNLALEMLKSLRQSGHLRGQWVTCDEDYGKDPEFLDTQVNSNCTCLMLQHRPLSKRLYVSVVCEKPIETCFEDSKQLLGMGDYEVRSRKRLASPHDFGDVSPSFPCAVAISC